MEILKKIVPFIVGVALIGAGIFVNIRTGELSRVCTEPATATVVNMREDFTSDVDSAGLRYLYYPVIQYQAAGETVTGELGNASNPPAYNINDRVNILYNPANIHEFIVAGENQNIIWIFLVVFGVVFIGAGIYLLIKKPAGKN